MTIVSASTGWPGSPGRRTFSKKVRFSTALRMPQMPLNSPDLREKKYEDEFLAASLWGVKKSGIQLLYASSASTLAAQMKSFCDSPPTEWVLNLTVHLL